MKYRQKNEKNRLKIFIKLFKKIEKRSEFWVDFLIFFGCFCKKSCYIWTIFFQDFWAKFKFDKILGNSSNFCCKNIKRNLENKPKILNVFLVLLGNFIKKKWTKFKFCLFFHFLDEIWSNHYYLLVSIHYPNQSQ